MVGSLVAMLVFRRSNKGRLSSANEFNVKLKSMKINAFLCLFVAATIAIIGAYFIMWNTFPDSIAVYNPFEKRIILRNIDSFDSFVMFW